MSEELLKAAIALRDDMIARAKANDADDIVVEAGAGVWHRFNEAIDAAQPVEGLRAALEECASVRTDLDDRSDYARGWNDARFRIRQIANKALASETTPASDIAAEGVSDAEAVREACAKVADAYADDQDKTVRASCVAAAIRAMPLPQAEAAKVAPVAWMYEKDGVVDIVKSRSKRPEYFTENGWTETPLIPAPKGQSDE